MFSRASTCLFALCIAMCGTIFGCTAGARTDCDSRSLQVVRVKTESGMRAGTPVADDYVLSVMDWQDAAVPGVVADGNPMQWDTSWGGEPRSFPGRADEFPLVAPFIGNSVFCANSVSEGATPAPGAEVLVGGYSFADAPDAEAKWSVAPEFITARVTESPTAARTPPQKGLIWLEAAPGHYDGFRGGPVAMTRDEGPPMVFAVILFQQAMSDASTPAERALLAAQLIPPAWRAKSP